LVIVVLELTLLEAPCVVMAAVTLIAAFLWYLSAHMGEQ